MASEAFMKRVIARLRALAKEKGHTTRDQLDAIVRDETARQGGLSRAERRRLERESGAAGGSGSGDKQSAASAGAVAASDRTGGGPAAPSAGAPPAGSRTNAGPVLLADAPREWFSDINSDLQEALTAQYGDHISIIDTSMAAVRYAVYRASRDEEYKPPEYYEQPYSFTGADGDEVDFGERIEIERSMSWVPVEATDADRGLFYTRAVALLGGSDGLPEWIQVHKVGTWAVEHGEAGQIELTDAKADELIANFHNKALRLDVPLQEGHAKGARAFAWFSDMRRGYPGEGKRGGPEPSGKGPILYAKPAYNEAGRVTLGDEQYKYVSPGYDRNYRDKETGKRYGWVLLHVAALNDPYLRLRSIQGVDCPEPAMLSDAAPGRPADQTSSSSSSTGGDAMTPEEEARMKALEAKLSALEGLPAQLEAATQRNTELAARLSTSEEEKHFDRVKAIRKSAIAEGVPVALADVITRVMLAAEPKADGVVTLSDAEGSPKVNVFAAMEEALRQAPRVNVGGRRSLADDTQPPGASVDKLTDQFKKGRREMLDELGYLDVVLHDDPAAGGRARAGAAAGVNLGDSLTNGSHANGNGRRAPSDPNVEI